MLLLVFLNVGVADMSKEPTIVLGEEYNQLLSFIGSIGVDIKPMILL